MNIIKLGQAGFGLGGGGPKGGRVITRVEVNKVDSSYKVFVLGHKDGAKCANSDDAELVQGFAEGIGVEVEKGKTVEAYTEKAKQKTKPTPTKPAKPWLETPQDEEEKEVLGLV